MWWHKVWILRALGFDRGNLNDKKEVQKRNQSNKMKQSNKNIGYKIRVRGIRILRLLLHIHNWTAGGFSSQSGIQTKYSPVYVSFCFVFFRFIFAPALFCAVFWHDVATYLDQATRTGLLYDSLIQLNLFVKVLLPLAIHQPQHNSFCVTTFVQDWSSQSCTKVVAQEEICDGSNQNWIPM